jgi:hypothetical protein
MQNTESFHYSWGEFMKYAALAFLGLGLLTFLYYEIRVFLKRDLKKKYDFVNHNEIRMLWVCALFLIVSAVLFINTLGAKLVVANALIGFIIRIFISAALFVIAYTLLKNLISVYYPSYVERRLTKIRRKPRRSPDGNLMRLLSEEEEDVHLDEGMQAEEKFFSVDYDVWVDEKTGYKKIEKYLGFQHAEQCPECDYYTLKTDWEKVEVPPTYSSTGKLSRHYTCQYCNHKETRAIEIARLSSNVSNATA